MNIRSSWWEQGYFSVTISPVTMRVILLFSHVLLLAGSAARAQSWLPIGPDDNEGDIGINSSLGYFPSMGLNANGNPIVAFEDWMNGGIRLTVVRWDGIGWTVVGSPGISQGSVSDPSLAIDSQGLPVVAYSDDANGHRVSVQRFDGSNWVIVGTLGISEGEAYDISLALDSADNPVVAYLDLVNDYKATVLRWDGTAWSALGGAGIDGSNGVYVSLAIEASGTPLIAFRGTPTGTTVLRWSGDEWNPVGQLGFGAGQASFQSLALDAEDRPVVAFREMSLGGRTSVMRWNGTEWNYVGQQGFSAGDSDEQCLALDVEDNPVVAFKDYTDEHRVTVMRWDGMIWSIVGEAGFTTSTAVYGTDRWLCITPSGVPIVAYANAGIFCKGFGVDVGLSPIEEAHAQLFYVSPNPSNGMVRVTTPLAIDELHYTLFDATGRIVSAATGVIQAKSLDLNFNSVRRGCYYLRLWWKDGHRVLVLTIK